MQTEATRRLGGHAYTGFPARVQRWIEAAYFWATSTYHHPELDTEDASNTLAVGESSVPLFSDVKVPVSVALLQPGTTTLDRYLKLRDFHVIQAQFDETRGKPTLYARFGNSLRFERKSNAAYPISVFYYRKPPAPLFGADDSSLLAEEWDEIILVKTTCLGFSALWRPDLARLRTDDLKDLLADVPNRRLDEDATADRSTRSRRDRTLQGVQG
jgi:hypothetical protein